MNEKEHILLVKCGDEFCDDLATATVKVLQQFDPETRDEVYMYLQDHTSLYSPFTADLITVGLEKGT